MGTGRGHSKLLGQSEILTTNAEDAQVNRRKRNQSSISGYRRLGPRVQGGKLMRPREASRKRKQDTRSLETMLRGLDFVLKVVGSHGRL